MNPAGWLRSLKTRLAALFVCLMVVVLFLGGGFILDEQEHSLLHSIDSSLTSRADDLVALLEVDTSPGNLGISRDEDTIAMILDADGTVLTTTDAFGDPDEMIAVGAEHAGRGRTGSLPSFRETDGTDRMRVVQARGPGGESIYVAQSLRGIDDSLDALQNTLLTVGLAVTVIAGALAWLVARQALRPVRQMAHKADDISLSRLDQRLPAPTRPDEIGELTDTLNSMLTRLDASAGRQRRLIADVAHELRSPLSAVAVQLDVGLAHPETTDWESTASDALEEARRLQTLIDDLLLLARMDEDDPGPQEDLVDLDEIVLDAVSRLASTTEIELDASNVSAGLVKGNRSQLERSVQNLIDNAVRHAGTVVVARLRESADLVVLEIEDDGPGVPVSERQRIFKRFYRTQAARDRASGGTGIGLALTSETIAAHGGTIRVTDSPSGGAAFVVELPAAASAGKVGPSDG